MTLTGNTKQRYFHNITFRGSIILLYDEMKRKEEKKPSKAWLLRQIYHMCYYKFVISGRNQSRSRRLLKWPLQIGGHQTSLLFVTSQYRKRESNKQCVIGDRLFPLRQDYCSKQVSSTTHTTSLQERKIILGSSR